MSASRLAGVVLIRSPPQRPRPRPHGPRSHQHDRRVPSSTSTPAARTPIKSSDRAHVNGSRSSSAGPKASSRRVRLAVLGNHQILVHAAHLKKPDDLLLRICQEQRPSFGRGATLQANHLLKTRRVHKRDVAQIQDHTGFPGLSARRRCRTPKLRPDRTRHAARGSLHPRNRRAPTRSTEADHHSPGLLARASFSGVVSLPLCGRATCEAGLGSILC